MKVTYIGECAAGCVVFGGLVLPHGEEVEVTNQALFNKLSHNSHFVTKADKETEQIDATDQAYALAEKSGIDLTTVTATGTNGKVTVSDVRNHGSQG